MHHLGWWFCFLPMCVWYLFALTFVFWNRSLFFHCKHKNGCDRYSRFCLSFYFVFLYVFKLTWCVKRHVSFLLALSIHPVDYIKAFVDSFHVLLNCHRGLIRPEPKNDTYTVIHEKIGRTCTRYYYLCCVMMNQQTEENKVQLKWT
jgi:hypothetical protein